MRVEQLDSRRCTCGHFELEHLGGEAFCRADGCDCESAALVRLHKHKHYSDPNSWPKGKRPYRVGAIVVTALCRCGAVRLETAPRSIAWTSREELAQRLSAPTCTSRRAR